MMMAIACGMNVAEHMSGSIAGRKGMSYRETTCGHQPYYAKGLCRSCYRRERERRLKRKEEQKQRRMDMARWRRHEWL